MKRFLVVFALFLGILVAAAACCTGGGGSAATAQSRNSSANYSQAGGTAIGAPAKGVPDQSGGGTTVNPGSSVVPPIQGPQVIRQGQLSISVKAGTFDSSLSAVRSLVELEQGYVAGTDAQ